MRPPSILQMVAWLPTFVVVTGIAGLVTDSLDAVLGVVLIVAGSVASGVMAKGRSDADRVVDIYQHHAASQRNDPMRGHPPGRSRFRGLGARSRAAENGRSVSPRTATSAGDTMSP
ncbi:hypothetical protein MSHI_09840 [Mycobacterium shinjukuense]|uniref:Uncharacterized protein n=1 Tax=Mycobacterium shinjukuense TaxID=398694 RepID=A0A7I7MLF8_9MYCO|nr:hypothetical protein MSHI_09840 [Mycobacterium shinjukuense]